MRQLFACHKIDHQAYFRNNTYYKIDYNYSLQLCKFIISMSTYPLSIAGGKGDSIVPESSIVKSWIF